MRVLAFDPGYDRLGVAVLERRQGVDALLYSSCIESNRADDLATRLFMLGEKIEALCLEYRPDAVGVETLFFNKNQRTAIGVAQMRGIILYIAKKHGCVVGEFGPQEVKVAVTGYGKSDKEAVFNMVKRLLPNVPETALDDEYDAIAVGMTLLACYRTSPPATVADGVNF